MPSVVDKNKKKQKARGEVDHTNIDSANIVSEKRRSGGKQPGNQHDISGFSTPNRSHNKKPNTNQTPDSQRKLKSTSSYGGNEPPQGTGKELTYAGAVTAADGMPQPEHSVGETSDLPHGNTKGGGGIGGKSSFGGK